MKNHRVLCILAASLFLTVLLTACTSVAASSPTASSPTASETAGPGGSTTTANSSEPAIASETATVESESIQSNDPVPLSKQELAQMYTNPNDFKGRAVDIYAQIFTDVEHNANSTTLQAYQDAIHSERNTIISIDNPDLDVADGDIIHVIGQVVGQLEGENAFGGLVSAPMVKATVVEPSDYMTAFAPALRTIAVNQRQNQKGYVVQIKNVEIAESETRVYLRISNKMKQDIRLFSYGAKLIQGKKQFATQTNYDADYPTLETDFLPGVVEDGMLVFEPISLEGGTITINLDGSADDWKIDIKPFVFKVSLQ